MKRMLNTSDWAMEQLGSCELGDLRRAKRAVRVATQIADYPDGSTPDQTERWADLKAAYRLFDAEDVTFYGIGGTALATDAQPRRRNSPFDRGHDRNGLRDPPQRRRSGANW